MNRLFLCLLAVSFAFAVGCGPAQGALNGACYGNGTCNTGLACVANQCVQANDAATDVAADAVADAVSDTVNDTPAADVVAQDALDAVSMPDEGIDAPAADVQQDTRPGEAAMADLPRTEAGLPCPGAEIWHPGTETRVAGTSVPFIGRARDTDCSSITGSRLVWTDSLEGSIGTGEMFSHTFTMTGLHTVTLTATLTGGGTVTATVAFMITP